MLRPQYYGVVRPQLLRMTIAPIMWCRCESSCQVTWASGMSNGSQRSPRARKRLTALGNAELVKYCTLKQTYTQFDALPYLHNRTFLLCVCNSDIEYIAVHFSSVQRCGNRRSKQSFYCCAAYKGFAPGIKSFEGIDIEKVGIAGLRETEARCMELLHGAPSQLNLIAH